MSRAPYTVGGVGAQPSLDDIVKVALGHPIALDTAAAERLKKESPPPKAFVAEDAPDAVPEPAAERLSQAQSRAVLFVRLLTLMNGKSGTRLQVAEYLKGLLNAGTPLALPAAPSDAAILSAVANLCYGLSSVEQQQQAAAANASDSLPPPALSGNERLVLQSGSCACAGVASLVIPAGKTLITLASAVAALACEADGTQVKAFDADAAEAVPRKGVLAVADALRGFLDGSKQVGKRRAAAGGAVDTSAVLQTLGTADEALGGAYNAVRPEVQAGATAATAAATASPSSTLAMSLLQAAHSLVAVATASVARARVLAHNVPQLVPIMQRVDAVIGAAHQNLEGVGQQLLKQLQSPPAVAAALAADQALEAAQQAVAAEALAAVASLRLQEGPVEVPVSPSANGPSPVTAADGPRSAGAAEGKKKDRKKGGGMSLGKGTAVARASLERLAVGGALDAEDGDGRSVGRSLAVSEDRTAISENLEAAFGRIMAALASHSDTASKLVAELRSVVEANQARRKPKVAKGARDFLPEQMSIREQAFATITAVFKRHGAVSIDTPVFELRETLTGKYGEDSKLIYDLADQGGEILSLRYDLTVPFARYVAVNGITNIKRYHIGKVYRRDQPQMNRGRFREFFQCDFDIAGAYAVMVPDAEVLKVLVEILSDLQLGNFQVKLNHRKLLDAMLQIAGVPSQKFRAICSAIDKLDKEPWEVVRAEMVDDKGLSPAVADKIGEFVVLRGEPEALLQQLTSPDHPLSQHPDSRTALQELTTLFGYLRAMNALQPIVFDLSLARGLDYYTGVIYEAVLVGAGVGSIAAGGRYDTLVGMFSGKDVPAVGVSIGIERVFSIMEAQMRERAAASNTPIRATQTEVLVASVGNNMQTRRMELATKLWAAGIKAEFGFKPNPKMGDQLTAALEGGIPYMVIFGEKELSRDVVQLKDMNAKSETEVAVGELVSELQARLQQRDSAKHLA